MATDTVTIGQFVTDNRITMKSERTDRNPNMDESKDMDHWKCLLRRDGGARMTVYFSMGYGHHGEEPKTEEVLNCLASDAGTIENAQSFEDWCEEFGYDTDSRRAEKTYKACVHQTERLKQFLGPDLYDRLVWHTEE